MKQSILAKELEYIEHNLIEKYNPPEDLKLIKSLPKSVSKKWRRILLESFMIKNTIIFQTLTAVTAVKIVVMGSTLERDEINEDGE